jgi:putative phosphoesterase
VLTLVAVTDFVGLISDTHGLLRPAALSSLRGAVHLVHAGDVGAPAILAALTELAPLTVVRGNNDRGPWAEALPATARVSVGGVRLFVTHEAAHLDRHAPLAADVVVVGHSHRPLVERPPTHLAVNPGSAGPRRFSLPVCVARLHLGRELAVEVVDLETGESRWY